MSKLFEPLAVKGITLPNRFVRSATVENLGRQGLVTDSLELLYRELARGEVGLIVTGGLFPEREGQLFPGQLGAHSDETIAGLKRLTQAVHNYVGKIAAQLLHSGWNCRPQVTGSRPKGPSALVNPHSRLQVRGLSTDEIEQLVIAFARSARRTREVAFISLGKLSVRLSSRTA
jgi:2,4-dienoyl-CoA reductase-like NADH-dependent reductase (Old Yellow Enzyme family)